MSSIRAENLVKHFGDIKAVNNLSVTFEEGKIYGLLGRNGAGKTTLLNIITNRIFADSGSVIVNNENVIHDNTSLSNIYLMSEKTYYPTSMRVAEAFKWTNEFYSFDIDYANILAEKFQLNTKSKISKLSTGYTSIFKIIISLAVDVDFVIFDEPVLGLDAYHRDLFYKLLLKSYADRPRTFIISTHLIEEVSSIIENVIIIDKGSIIRNESCEELLKTGYTATGSVSNIDEFITGKNVIDTSTIGNLKSAYILDSEIPPKNLDNIEITKLDLQKLFIKLTVTGGNYEA
jgi:ABC-2 type transport system ATP-binding protein